MHEQRQDLSLFIYLFIFYENNVLLQTIRRSRASIEGSEEIFLEQKAGRKSLKRLTNCVI